MQVAHALKMSADAQQKMQNVTLSASFDQVQDEPASKRDAPNKEATK
jgi:hypothetical protein